MASGGFGGIDWAVLAGYFAVLIATGVIFTRSQNSTDDYFRASGKVPVFAAAISFLATALSHNKISARLIQPQRLTNPRTQNHDLNPRINPLDFPFNDSPFGIYFNPNGRNSEKPH